MKRFGGRRVLLLLLLLLLQRYGEDGRGDASINISARSQMLTPFRPTQLLRRRVNN